MKTADGVEIVLGETTGYIISEDEKTLLSFVLRPSTGGEKVARVATPDGKGSIGTISVYSDPKPLLLAHIAKMDGCITETSTKLTGFQKRKSVFARLLAETTQS